MGDSQTILTPYSRVFVFSNENCEFCFVVDLATCEFIQIQTSQTFQAVKNKKIHYDFGSKYIYFFGGIE